MNRYRIFVIDDEQIVREGIALTLSKYYQVRGYASAEAALEAMASTPPDLILLDIGLPGMNGIEALEKIKFGYPQIIIIMMTAYEDVETVVSAMKRGVYDYVVKPMHMDRVLLSIGNALETISLRKEVNRLQKWYFEENLPCLISSDTTVQDAVMVVEKMARVREKPILISSGSGLNNEMIARAIHFQSRNLRGPLVAVNCEAIPEEQIERDLFGDEKGASVRDALPGKAGLLEASAGGTLFLGEVSALNLAAQDRLMAFLEDGEFCRVGGSKKCRVETRIVSATTRNLPQITEEGRFRRDLYRLLTAASITIPDLNQRRDGILPIANSLLSALNRKLGKNLTGISPEALTELQRLNQNGNIHELRNLIERGILRSHGSMLSSENLGWEASSSNQ